ncbi:hypothetical protein, partial [Aeromonas veronii]
LLAGSSPAWQQLLLEHFSLQLLLDAPYEERWPLANALVRCAPEVQARAKAFEAEWRWLCGDGE